MRARAVAVVAAVLLLSVASSGCLTVYAVRSALTTDPRAYSLEFERRIAYERHEDPQSGCPPGSSEARGILVPQHSEWVSVFVFAKITAAPPILQPVDTRHFDFTVADGNGTVWVDVHLKGNDTRQEVTIDGPRPGGWTVTLSFYLCDADVPPFRVDDQFTVRVEVRQPI